MEHERQCQICSKPYGLGAGFVGKREKYFHLGCAFQGHKQSFRLIFFLVFDVFRSYFMLLFLIFRRTVMASGEDIDCFLEGQKFKNTFLF